MPTVEQGSIQVWDEKYVLFPNFRGALTATTDLDDVDPFAESSTQQLPLGTFMMYGDRWFRYAENGGTALAAGKVVQSEVPIAGNITAAVNTAAAGDASVEFTEGGTAGIAVNSMAGGYLNVDDATGEGHLLRIQKNDAISTSGAGTIFLSDPVVTAFEAASTCTIIKSPWKDVIIHASPPTAMVSGVPPIPVTADYFFWAQTHGPASVLTDGTVVIGEQVRGAEGSADGAVAALDYDESGRDEAVVGYVMSVAATTKYSTIFLTIE